MMNRHVFWKLAAESVGWSYEPLDAGALRAERLLAAAAISRTAVAVVVAHMDDHGALYPIAESKVGFGSTDGAPVPVRVIAEALKASWGAIDYRLRRSISKFVVGLCPDSVTPVRLEDCIEVKAHPLVPGLHRPKVRRYHLRKLEDLVFAAQPGLGVIPCELIRSQFSLADGRVVADPIGKESCQLRLRAEVMGGEAELMLAVLDSLRALELRPTAVVSPFTCLGGALTELERKYGATVVDASEDGTCIGTFSGDSLARWAVAGHGTGSVLTAVGDTLGIWPGHVERHLRDAAELIRLRSGDATVVRSVPARPDGAALTFGDLIGAARAPMRNVFDVLAQHVKLARSSDVVVRKIILLGDNALAMRALERLCREELKVECEWRRFDEYMRNTELSASDWAVVLGAMRQAAGQRQPRQPWLERQNDGLTDRLNRWISGLPVRLGESLLTVGAMAACYWRSRRHSASVFNGALKLDRRASRNPARRMTFLL
jgi:hypothetical protein